MKHVTAALATAALTAGLLAAPAAAQTPGDEHRCAGALTSAFAGPGFGTLVSGFARLQLVDNFGLANCGEPPRKNPL